MTQRSVVIIKVALWAACLAPLGLLVLQAFATLSAFARFGSLGANPVEQILNVCGKTGLNLLMLTLCITPIRRSTGINKLDLVPPAARPVRVLLSDAALLDLRAARPGPPLSTPGPGVGNAARRHHGAPVHHGRLHGVWCC